MALRWIAKAPEEVVTRDIPWFGPLNGDEIDTATLTFLDTNDTSGLSLGTPIVGPDLITVQLTGGTAGYTAALKSQIVTLGVGGQPVRTLDQIVFIDIIDPQYAPVPSAPATTTKRAVVLMAYRRCALAGYEFDQTPEELQAGMVDLDAVMAQKALEGLNVGYNFPTYFGGGDLDDAFGAPDGTVQWAAYCLAQSLAGALGYSLPREMIVEYVRANSAVLGAYQVIPTMHLDRRTPLGAGNKPWSIYQPFVRGGYCRGANGVWCNPGAGSGGNFLELE